jgi:hypothetical protein
MTSTPMSFRIKNPRTKPEDVGFTIGILRGIRRTLGKSLGRILNLNMLKYYPQGAGFCKWPHGMAYGVEFFAKAGLMAWRDAGRFALGLPLHP